MSEKMISGLTFEQWEALIRIGAGATWTMPEIRRIYKIICSGKLPAQIEVGLRHMITTAAQSGRVQR